MNELEFLLGFLHRTNTKYTTWTDPRCIDEKSVKDGAVISVSIRNVAHFNFNKEGVLLGTSTDSAKSYKARKIK